MGRGFRLGTASLADARLPAVVEPLANSWLARQHFVALRRAGLALLVQSVISALLAGWLAGPVIVGQPLGVERGRQALTLFVASIVLGVGGNVLWQIARVARRNHHKLSGT